jgi:hypothetical protein
MADLQVSKGTGATALDVKAAVEARVKAAVDEGSTRLEIAEPEGWWNIWAMGPFQVTAIGGPLLPHKVIRVNETFSVAVVVWLSPTFIIPGGPGISVCQFISSLACDFRIDYCTNDMCALQPEPLFSPKDIIITTTPNQCFYVDTQTFTAQPGTESCIYEMNICARMTGCNGAPMPMAGFVTEVFDFDADTFYPPPGGTPTWPPIGTPPGGATPFPGVSAGWRFNQPLRFQIYP